MVLTSMHLSKGASAALSGVSWRLLATPGMFGVLLVPDPDGRFAC